MNDNEIRDLFAALPEIRQEDAQTAHHGRVARCAKSAYRAIENEEWPRRTYSDDVFPPAMPPVVPPVPPGELKSE